MKIDEALGVISAVCREYNGNLTEHTRIQTALKEVADYANATAVVMASDKKDIEATKKADSLELEKYRESSNGINAYEKWLKTDAGKIATAEEPADKDSATYRNWLAIKNAKDGDMVKVNNL